MSIDYLKRFGAKSSLNLALIETGWNWPSKEALGKAAQSRSDEELVALNLDLELFRRTGLKSCRLVKLLRDAWDTDWELQNTRSEPLKTAC